MNTDTMVASRELDEIIADKVLGFKRHEWKNGTITECVGKCDANDDECDCAVEMPGYICVHCGKKLNEEWMSIYLNRLPDHQQGICKYVPQFSCEIQHAWMVVEKFGFCVEGCGPGVNGKPAGYWVGFRQNGSLVGDVENETVAFGETAPLAICRAGLKAIQPVGERRL